jgi:hypothetical protein
LSDDHDRRSRSSPHGSGGSSTPGERTAAGALGRLVVALACLAALGGTGRVAEGADARARSGSPAAPAASGPELEHGIKAAFLLNFVRYTTWPRESFESDTSPLRVQVVGRDPFGKLLDDTLRDEKAHGRALEIVRTTHVPDEIRAHVVFCGELSRSQREELLERCRGKPILLVGETDGLAVDGACINFYLQEKKIRFEINTDAVSEASLKISASLLKLAKIVKSRREDR